ncbi:thiol-disulfide isomerase/thioredoxin [Sediminihabitans luteus]|uniref:Thiol-disulfide isomerase/thioredoxin n=1 Tax=Sediminihabitans luteus TaxID=1138585 RepID=A0A2M9CZN8_9CELL|nr:TlpA disulfide reductase family protein [Sediminihabitans luteus]PJJ77370.1 thiol-disulfide isomerase/thioredoxin [Sediminihabitans luteus]GII98263.1 thiol-disulfide isomerase [Sediminihabitans luteus]
MAHLRDASARPRARRAVADRALAAAALVGVLALAGCSQSSGVTNEGSDVTGQGYVSGDGSVKTWAPDDRSDPVTVTGTDFAGDPVDTSDHQGTVVLLNTWYAGCAPCRAEAPTLVALAEEHPDDVQIIGINGVDDAGAAQAFERTFSVPYPSIADTTGAAVATLQGTVPLQAVPTTVVLDQQGRVAARVIGEAEASTLDAIVGDVLAEDA